MTIIEQDKQMVNEIYNAGKGDADQIKADIDVTREFERTMGLMQKIKMDDSYNKLLHYLALFRIREGNLYRTTHKTWDDFCLSIGQVKRTVDRTLHDLRPLLEDFQDNFSQIFTMPFSKIRYLGKELGTQSSQIEGGEIVFEDTRIPLKPENKDDIEALIDAMKAAHKKAVQDKENELGALRKMNDNKRSDIERLESKIAKLERAAEVKGLEPGEDAYLDQISNQRKVFHGLCAWLDPDNPKTVPEDATPRMKAAYIEMLGYMRRIVCAAYDTAVDRLGNAAIDSEWEQPFDTPILENDDADVIDITQR